MPVRIPEEFRIKQLTSLPDMEFLGWERVYKNNYSKALMKCTIDGFEWAASVNNLINNHSKCPQCSGKRKWTMEDRIEQIKSLENIKLIGFVDGCSNHKSKAIVECEIDGFRWVRNVWTLVNAYYGCPQCSGNRRWTADERAAQISLVENTVFIRWDGEYRNGKSNAVVLCTKCGIERISSAKDIIHAKRNCPRCSNSGYDKTKRGFLYVLRSECGAHIKVGITNKPERRIMQLRNSTPFRFNLIERIEGEGYSIAGLERKFLREHQSAMLSGFDGATEWLVTTTELLNEIRKMGH